MYAKDSANEPANNLNYEEDVRIDEQALDVEWLRQPTLMHTYSRYAAWCRTQVDEIKERLEARKAEIELDIRAHPESYGLTKITESAIQSAITLQPTYQEITEVYRNARYELEVANAAVRAIDQRKTALENLVRLLGASYFSAPAAPRNLAEEWDKRVEQKQSNRHVSIGQQQARRRS